MPSSRPTGPLRFPHVLNFLLCGSILQLQGAMGQLILSPMENITVHAGQTATFSCELVNAGLSGWNHKVDMVYLKGVSKPSDFSKFDRRYSFEDPGPTGTQRMSIHNISAADAGSVECFAALTAETEFAGWKRTVAFVTVLVPPKNVTVLKSALYSERSEIRMDETVNLTCLALEGQPKPKLIWYRGSRQVSEDLFHTLREGYSPTGNITFSTLLFKATPADNQADFTCQAESPALPNPESRTVTLDIQYPPVTPVIQNCGERRAVRENDHLFSLTCVSDGGNPTPRLTWFRNGHQEESSTDSSQLASPRGRATSVLTFVPRRADNGVVLKCEAVNDLMPRGVAVQTILDVHFGPEKVTLEAPSKVNPGDTVDLKCSSTGSNPPADITWTINNKPYTERSKHTQPSSDGSFVTTSTVKLVLRSDEHSDIMVVCRADNKATREVASTTTTVIVAGSTILPPTQHTPNRFSVFDQAGNELLESNSTDYAPSDASLITGTKPESWTMIVAIACSVGGIVFFVLLGCLIYVIIRGKAKKFEEMANSDSSGSSKGHTEVCSQNGLEAVDSGISEMDNHKISHDYLHHPKGPVSPSAVRTNAASTYLLDEAYHSPYGTYKHWTAPEPVHHDMYNEVGVDYEGEGDYTETLRRTAMQSLMPHMHNHSPSPLRPIPMHISYEPIHKTSMLSTFHGQHIPTYRAEALVDELKGHLV